MTSTFGRLIINDHGKRLIQEQIDAGLTNKQATLLVNGENAVQVALAHRPWPTAPSEDALRNHLTQYIPLGYQITFAYGNTTKDYVAIDGILTVAIAKDILPKIEESDTAP